MFLDSVGRRKGDLPEDEGKGKERWELVEPTAHAFSKSK